MPRAEGELDLWNVLGLGRGRQSLSWCGVGGFLRSAPSLSSCWLKAPPMRDYKDICLVKIKTWEKVNGKGMDKRRIQGFVFLVGELCLFMWARPGLS